jgi:hypothetical protein
MNVIQLKSNTNIEKNDIVEFDLQDKPLSEKVKLSILKDLWNLNWKINFKGKKIELSPPAEYDREIIRQSMSIKREEIINKNFTWIEKNIKNAQQNLADGVSVINSEIIPEIEVCENEKQHSLFKIFRYYWSSPYSEYVGRRIKLIIRDAALPNKPVIGIAALGSPIIHIPERDNFIGWDKNTRTNNLIYAMDAYVIGALPPYNYLLGGKLISYILASKEIRKIYKKKYNSVETLINKRKVSDLVCLFTTSLYGHSSQYNRMKYKDLLLYKPIGETKGYGTLHLTENTINLMKQLLNEKKMIIGNEFGNGPSWRMRLIRAVGDLLDFDSDLLLKHSFKRKIYFVPLAENSIEILRGENKKPKYCDWSMNDLVEFWKERWLCNRKKNLNIVKQVTKFNPELFKII